MSGRARLLYLCAPEDDHPSVATTCNNLALLYQDQGKYAEAEPLYLRALSIKEKALGTDHPSVATTCNNLAGLYELQGRHQEATQLRARIQGRQGVTESPPAQNQGTSSVEGGSDGA